MEQGTPPHRNRILENRYWTIYMLECWFPPQSKGYYGRKTVFYTGITQKGLGKRLADHLTRENRKSWTATAAKDASLTPVYVEYLVGNEYEAMKRERKLKKLTHQEKKDLIKSHHNKLRKYIPLKAVILERYGKPDEQIALRLE